MQERPAMQPEVTRTTVMPTVLVVDDDPRARKLMRVILEHAGYAVTTVEDGAAALEELARRPADAILADLMMPGMDGIELIGRIRGDLRSRRTRTVLLTAMDTSDTRTAARAAGADDVMTKPVDRQELLRRLAALLDRPEPGDAP
jgi:DNA-binding response OmpR family regulator